MCKFKIELLNLSDLFSGKCFVVKKIPEVTKILLNFFLEELDITGKAGTNPGVLMISNIIVLALYGSIITSSVE